MPQHDWRILLAARVPLRFRKKRPATALSQLVRTSEQLKNIARFEKKLAADAEGSLSVRGVPNGGVAARNISPGRAPGSDTVYEKQIYSAGNTVQYTTTMYDPVGTIVQVKTNYLENSMMISSKEHRLSALRELLSFSRPVQETLSQLASMGWDYVGECAVLTRGHLVSVLQRYLSGDLSKVDVETWANYVEGREDVEFDAGHEQQIENTLYKLANPILTQSFDQTRAKALFT